MKINIFIIQIIFIIISSSILLYGNIYKLDNIGYSVNKKKIDIYKFGTGKNILIIMEMKEIPIKLHWN